MTWKSSFFLAFFSLFSQTISACACCGSENTWYQIDVTDSEYIASVINELSYTQAEWVFYPDEQEGQFQSVTKTPTGWVLSSTKHQWVFTTDSSQHRLVDVSFVAPESSSLGSSLIYHELVMSGTVLIHNEKIPATFIIQGSGGACVDATMFKRFMLKTKTGWTASGKILTH